MDTINQFGKQFSKTLSNVSNAFVTAGYITGIIIAIVGLILLIGEFLRAIKIARINHWPVIKNGGVIKDSYMETSSGYTTYSIFFISSSYFEPYYRTRASFVYQINGQTYIGNKISYYEPWQTNPMYSKLEADLYKPGQSVDIRVNPKNPTEAYIINKFSLNYYNLFIGMLLTVIGLYVVYKSKKN